MLVKEDLVWSPNVGLGPVTFGSPVGELTQSLGAYADVKISDETGWDSYCLPEVDLSVDAEDGKIVAIRSYSTFFYKGENLIGMSIIQAGRLLGRTADEIGAEVEYDDGDVQVSFDFINEGLQVWTSHGRVVSATCME